MGHSDRFNGSRGPITASRPDRHAISGPASPAVRGGRDGAPVYRVRAERSRIERQAMGSDEARVRVPLSGRVDEGWRRAYRLVQLDSTGLFRYRLELESAAVTFTARHPEGSLAFLMDELDAFIERANAQASLLSR